MVIPDLPTELWELVLNYRGAAAVAHDSCTTLYEIAKRSLLDELPTHIEHRLSSNKTFLQTEVCELLLLSPNKVKQHPFIRRRRYGGGEFHIFEAETVYKILESEGGPRALHTRVAAQRKRQYKKHKRETDAQHRHDTVRRVHRIRQRKLPH
jgi:hypothetical protein